MSLVGARVLRVEDARLLTGRGAYVADVPVAALAHMVVIRSDHPHAELRAIDTTTARAMPGVLGVFTGADYTAEGLGAIPWELRPPGVPATVALGDPRIASPQPVLAQGVVRDQGEPIAIVVAESHAAALDAAEAVVIDCTARAAVLNARAAERTDAPQIWPQLAGNICFRVRAGDATLAAKAFADAHHVTRLRLDIPRLVQNPIEPRSYLGEYAEGRYTLHAAAGKPQTIGRAIARDCFGIPADRVRVIARDVGGSFGAKNTLYAESILVLWAARKLGRPVRWVASRTDCFLSDMQAREQSVDAALALDANGRITALRARILTNLGAYLGQRGATPPNLMSKIITSMYDIPLLD